MNAWGTVTQLGNSVLMLPTAIGIAVGLSMVERFTLASRWLAGVVLVASVALVTKVAFLGWGIGSRALDFTGVSGHALLAAAILPTLGWWWTWERSRPFRTGAIALGAAVATTVGISRLVLEAHSMSEVLFGLAMGAAVVAVVVGGAGPAPAGLRYRWIVAVALSVALAWAGESNAVGAHGLVVRLALFLSGRTEPFSRADL